MCNMKFPKQFGNKTRTGQEEIANGFLDAVGATTHRWDYNLQSAVRAGELLIQAGVLNWSKYVHHQQLHSKLF